MNNYSKELNNLNLSVSEGEYEGYSIKFDLTFIDGGSNIGIEQLFMDDKTQKYEGHNISNRMAKWDETYKGFRSRDNGDVAGGVTQENMNIVMNKDKDTKLNRWHEIFHTLGLDHASNGVMRPYSPQEPTTNDANNLINNKYMSERRIKK